MFQVAIFDCGGVITPDSDEWTTTFKRIPQLTGLAPNQLEKMFIRHWVKLKIGQEDLIEFWQEVAEKSKEKITAEELEQAYLNDISIDQKILNFIKTLKRKYQLAILANQAKQEMDFKIKKFKLDQLFNKIYSSASLGMAKPDLRIFKFVLEDLNQKPEEVVFIDNQENNTQAAESLGIKSILFKNLKQIKKLFF